jgi:hypothetical protein
VWCDASVIYSYSIYLFHTTDTAPRAVRTPRSRLGRGVCRAALPSAERGPCRGVAPGAASRRRPDQAAVTGHRGAPPSASHARSRLGPGSGVFGYGLVQAWVHQLSLRTTTYLRRGMVNFISQSRPKWAMPRQSRWVRDAQTTHEHSDTPRYTRVPIRYTPRVFPLIARTHKRRERTRAAALPGLRRRSCRAKQALTAPVGRVWPARTRAGVAWGSQRPKRTPHSTHTARHHF